MKTEQLYAHHRSGGNSRMPFTAHSLRYHAEESYPLLYAYLQRYTQRLVGSVKFDAFELDLVVGHVVEQLVRLGLIGGGDRTPLSTLDHLTDEQFMAFLHRSLRNKIIDRLRKPRLFVNSMTELETPAVLLPVNEEGEFYQGDILLSPSEGIRDPALEYERKELIEEVLDDVVQLPPIQMKAMICVLKDEVGDTFPLVEEFAKRGVDIRSTEWPKDESERLRLKASLSVARKKVGHSMGIKQSGRDRAEKAPAVQRHDALPADGNEPPALDQRSGAQECAGMEAYIDKLREPYRTAVQLHYVKKHTYQQLVEELNQPLGTVKSHISRGMQMLRKLREMGPALHEASEQGTDIAEIVARVGTLDEPYRTPVELHYVKKRTCQQIARQLNLPKGTVKSQISRGIQILRKSA